MKKQKKNLIVMIASLVCVIAMSMSVSAAKEENNNTTNQIYEVNAVDKDSDFDIVQAKLDLAKLHEDKYVEMNETDIQARLDEIDSLLASNLTEKEKQQALEEMDVYTLDIPSSNVGEYASDASYVTLYSPKIYYNAKNKYWGIYASGRYNKFPDDISTWDVWWPTKGKRYNIGGVDCYGFAIEDTSGSYTASLKSQKCIISTNTNISYGTRTISTSKATGSGKYGIGFEIQDQAIITSGNAFHYNYTYLGYSFACIGWYTDSFKNYRGNVQTIYAHTYSNCEVSSFTIGLEAGASSNDGAQVTGNCGISISKAKKGFKCSSSDTSLSSGFKTNGINPRSEFNP